MTAGMTANMDRPLFRDVLHELLVHAISRGPADRVLLGAHLEGGQLHVSVTDDGRVTELEAQRAALRPVERLAAGLGASLGIEIWPGQGTTVVLRLPISVTTPAIEPSEIRTALANVASGQRHVAGSS